MAALLCAERGRFLYEARPDLFPEARLAEVEMAVWGMFYAEKSARDRERGGMR